MPGLADVAQKILTAGGQSLEYRRDGQTVLLNTRYIPEFEWHLVVEQTEGEAFRQIRGTLLINLGICALITTAVLLITHRTLSRYQAQMEKTAATDKLTGAYNRKGFDPLFNQARAECQRTGRPLSVMLFDLDHFKRVNDTLGHQAGDAVLQEVAARVGASIRESDLFFRWGGEEFLVVLKDCTLAHALRIAETIRANIQAPPLHHRQRPIEMTASFGVAQYVEGEDVDRLVSRVDQALYLAKARGRNRSETAADLGEQSPRPAAQSA
jgi:diguanylate cyclase (GGDEF)-like protein